MNKKIIITIAVIAAVAATGFIVLKSTASESGENSNSGPAGLVAGDAAITAGDGAIHINTEQFKALVFNYDGNPTEWSFAGDKPCIVDFYADWCAPCKIAAPVLDELAKEYKGRINIYKVDTEVEKELAGAFNIRSIPTFLLCPTEGGPQMFSGIGQTPEQTKEIFRQAIEEVLLAKK